MTGVRTMRPDGVGEERSVLTFDSGRTDGHDGVVHDGVVHDGVVHEGVVRDGAGHDGVVHDGAGHDGVAHDVSVEMVHDASSNVFS